MATATVATASDEERNVSAPLSAATFGHRLRSRFAFVSSLRSRDGIVKTSSNPRVSRQRRRHKNNVFTYEAEDTRNVNRLPSTGRELAHKSCVIGFPAKNGLGRSMRPADGNKQRSRRRRKQHIIPLSGFVNYFRNARTVRTDERMSARAPWEGPFRGRRIA
jgi:hypothetical protein